MMAKPFPDMPYWGAFPAMGPIPPGKASDPAKYAPAPVGDRPVHVQGLHAGEVLDAGPEPQLGPEHRPGPSPVRRRVGHAVRRPEPEDRPDQLNDEGDGQTTLTFDNVQASNFIRPSRTPATAWSSAPRRVLVYWAPDYRKITDIDVRKALAYAYPYAGRLGRRWLDHRRHAGAGHEHDASGYPRSGPSTTRFRTTSRVRRLRQVEAAAEGRGQRGLPDPVPVRAATTRSRWTSRTRSSRA